MAWLLSRLIQVSFDFHIPFANPVGFKPVQLHFSRAAVRQANRRETLQLPPAPATMNPPEVRKNANRRSDCDYFDIRNRADKLEFHSLHLISTVFPRQTGNRLYLLLPGRGVASHTLTSRGFGVLPHCPLASSVGNRSGVARVNRGRSWRRRAWAASAAGIRIGSPCQFPGGHGFSGSGVASQILTVWLYEAMARRLPSGLKAKLEAGLLLAPLRVRSS